MSDVNANIGIHFDTSDALAQLRQLQAGLSKFNQALTEGNVAAANAQKGLNAQLVQSINATGKFIASQKNITSSTASFTDALEKNKLSMGQYFRYTAAAATLNNKTLQGAFKQEKDILNRAIKDRVKSLQTQYIQITNANGELVKTLQVVPKHLRMVNGAYADYATRMQIAAQRQQFLNQLIKQGSTQLLNFGKNTQWAGRQLMVGLTIPLSMLGSAAAKTFKDMEMATVKFSRVYGDMVTSMSDTDKAIKQIQQLAKEFTKFGIAAVDTMNMAADAAAMGLTGNALTAQVSAATKLAVLGQVSQQDALQTTISLQNAFGISSEQLAGKINYLNAVENQTVLSIQDMTTAIPKAAPVVKQLGGSVEDLAFFLTAMREGGINASEGANALKSGLASIINPTKAASDMLAGFGINIRGIVDANAGNLKTTVIGLAQALNTLDPLNRARAIEQMFGKFQFARISTLFQNITSGSSQAAKALGLASASVEELAILSQRELGKVENAVSVKFQKQMENLKLQLMPVGKAFLQAVTPIVKFAGTILEKFNNLSDGTKKFVIGTVAVLGGIAPVVLMTVGLIANGAANLIKFFGMLRGGMAKLNGQNNVLGGGFDYLTQAEIDNLTQSQALHITHKDLIETFNVEKTSVDLLANAYQNAASQARALASGSPGLFNASPGAAGAVSGLPKKFADGGVVPGSGDGDTVPAMLTPGEVVLTKDTVKNNPGLVAALQNDSVKKYNDGTGGGSKSIASSLMATFVTGGDGSEAFKSRMSGLLEGAMSETQTGLARVIRFAKASGVEITAEQKDSIEYWRKEMLKAIEEAGNALIDQVNLSRNQIKDRLKGMSPFPGSQSEGTKNTYDLIDTHGAQNEVQTFAHTEKSNSMDYKTLDAKLKPGKVKNQMSDIQSSVDYINNLPDSDPRKPKNKIVPQYTPVSAAGLQGITQELNKELDLGTATIDKFFGEFDNLSGVQMFTPSLKNAGVDLKEFSTEIEAVKPIFREYLDNIAVANGGLVSDTQLKEAWDATANDPRVNSRVGLGMRQSSNNISAVRLAGVSPEEAALIEEVKNNGEVNRKSKVKSIVPKSGSAIGGEAGRVNRLGVFSEELDADLTNAEVNIAKTKSPSKRTEELGKNIGKGLENGLSQSQSGVKAQSEKLAEAAIPTAAQTADKVSKMDLGNKAFYDDINTPDMYEQRQILKSQDRQRRKLGATRTVDASTVATPLSSTSTGSISITSNRTIINQEQQKADAANLEAARLEQVAAKARITAAKWRASASKSSKRNKKETSPADELDKIAQNAEKKAAALRQDAAESEKIIAETKATAKAAKKAKKAQEKYADSSDKVAKSSVDLLDKEQSVSQAAGNIANNKELEAQATGDSAQSAISTAQLSDSIENNMNEVSSNSERISKAQQDQLESEQRQAQIYQDVEKEKAKQRELLRQHNAKLMAENAGDIIPDKSQTGGMIPSTAMSSADAYDLASSYTRDRNGSILIDPETGNPTTLTAKQLSQKKRGMRREKVGKYSGKAAGALGTAAMVAGMAGAPPQVTAALGTASTVASFAPMLAGLSGPQGIVVALAAAAAGLYLWNRHLKAADAAQAKYIDSISATTKKMQSIGEITGKVGASELIAKQNQNLFQDYLGRDRKGSPFGATFTGSEVGKAMQKAFSDNVKKVGAQEAAKAIALELGSYVSDGVMTAEQANSVADAIGINLQDKTYAINIQGELRTLIGHNGEDLIKNPMAIRMNIIDQSAARVDTALGNMDAAKLKGNSGRAEAAQIGALSANAVQLAQAQADATQKMYEDQKRALDAQLAATADKAKQVELQGKLSDLMSKQSADMTLMNGMVQAQLDKQIKIFEMRIQGSGWAGPSGGMVKGSTGGNGQEDAYFNSLKSTVTDKYKGTDQESLAKDVLSRTSKFDDKGKFLGFLGGKSKWETQGFESRQDAKKMEVQMDLMMSSGQMSPSQANSLLNMFDKQLGTLQKTLKIGAILHGNAKTIAALELFSGFSDKKQATELGVKLVQSDPATFDRITKTMGSLQFLDGSEINVEAMLKVNGYQKLNELSLLLDKIDTKFNVKKPITLDYLIKFDAENGTGLAGMGQEGIDWINNFKSEKDRQQALKTYQEIKTSYQLTFADEASKQQWINDQADKEATRQASAAFSKKGNKKTYNELYTTFQLTAKDKYSKQVADFLAGKNDNAVVGAAKTALGTDTSIDPKSLGATPPGPGNRDTTYDDIMKRLRNVRLAALNAAGGFKELERAIAASGSKAIKNQFNGLETQLIKLGKTAQFTDYLAGLDQAELNKFGKVATKADVKKTGGKRKYKQVNPATGKIETVTETYKAGDFLLNDHGRKMEAGFNKAIIGDYHDAQLKTATLQQQELVARKKLVALGYNQADIETMIADENYRTLIATGRISTEELKQNAILTEQQRIQSKIASLYQTGKDANDIAKNQKRIPEVVKMMQDAGVSAEGIADAIKDPAMLDNLITGMDNFNKLSAEAKEQFNQALGFINEIPDRKVIDIVFNQTTEERNINAANAATQLFDAYKMIDENTLKNKQGNTYAGLQVQMDDLNNQSKIAQDAINITQSKIEGMQLEVDKMQRDIDTNFTRPIEQKQRSIDKLNRTAEISYTRPIQALQDRSTVLAHDLEVMSHAADAINEKYDKQQEALSNVQKINQQIIQQQQQQLGLADALSQGDIAAAAKAAQDMRATNASNVAQNTQDALQQARQTEIDALRGGVSGKSQKDIQEEQYQIGLQTYDLEQKKAAIDKQILAIQDEIYTLEQGRQTALDAIQVKTDAIAKIQFGTLLDQQADLKAINDKLLPLQQQSDILFKQIADADAQRVIQGHTRAEWDAILKAATAQEALLKGDLARALGGFKSDSNEAKDAWGSIKSAYDGIKSKSVQITHYIQEVYGKAPESQTQTNPEIKQTPSGTVPDSAAKTAAINSANAAITKATNDVATANRLMFAIGSVAAGAMRDEAQARLTAAQADLAKANQMSSGGIVPKYFAKGGYAIGTDTVPAMLTPGEFIMSRYAVNNYGLNNLRAINSGATSGDSVYNYSLSVNVSSDANPDEIARVVMSQIRQIDSQRIRGNRF